MVREGIRHSAWMSGYQCDIEANPTGRSVEKHSDASWQSLTFLGSILDHGLGGSGEEMDIDGESMFKGHWKAYMTHFNDSLGQSLLEQLSWEP